MLRYMSVKFHLRPMDNRNILLLGKILFTNLLHMAQKQVPVQANYLELPTYLYFADSKVRCTFIFIASHTEKSQ